MENKIKIKVKGNMKLESFGDAHSVFKSFKVFKMEFWFLVDRLTDRLAVQEMYGI